MHHQVEATPEQCKLAKWPHELFLLNLIFNHIFVFCATMLLYGTFPALIVTVPIASFMIITYLFIKGAQIARSDVNWFVKAHWKLAVKRNMLFTMLLTFACVVSFGGMWLSDSMGWQKIQTIALIGGFGLLPFMVSLLILIVLGNDAVIMARNSKINSSMAEQLGIDVSTKQSGSEAAL